MFHLGVREFSDELLPFELYPARPHVPMVVKIKFMESLNLLDMAMCGCILAQGGRKWEKVEI